MHILVTILTLLLAADDPIGEILIIILLKINCLVIIEHQLSHVVRTYNSNFLFLLPAILHKTKLLGLA